jgi:hypothetical protein
MDLFDHPKPERRVTVVWMQASRQTTLERFQNNDAPFASFQVAARWGSRQLE